MGCENPSLDITSLTKGSGLTLLAYFGLTTDNEIYFMLRKSPLKACSLSLVPNSPVKGHADVLIYIFIKHHIISIRYIKLTR